VENNSSDPEWVKKNFEAIRDRYRITGVGGVQEATGKKHADDIVDKEKDFENRKSQMKSDKYNVAVYVPAKKSIPNARPRQDNTPPSSIRTFALGEERPKKKPKGK